LNLEDSKDFWAAGVLLRAWKMQVCFACRRLVPTNLKPPNAGQPKNFVNVELGRLKDSWAAGVLLGACQMQVLLHADAFFLRV